MPGAAPINLTEISSKRFYQLLDPAEKSAFIEYARHLRKCLHDQSAATVEKWVCTCVKNKGVSLYLVSMCLKK